MGEPTLAMAVPEIANDKTRTAHLIHEFFKLN